MNILKVIISCGSHNNTDIIQEVALNHAIEDVKPRCKLSHTILKEADGYNKFLDLSPYKTLIQLKGFLGGIRHCVTAVGKWILESDFYFALPLTKHNFGDFFINDNKTKQNKTKVTN